MAYPVSDTDTPTSSVSNVSSKQMRCNRSLATQLQIQNAGVTSPKLDRSQPRLPLGTTLKRDSKAKESHKITHRQLMKPCSAPVPQSQTMSIVHKIAERTTSPVATKRPLPYSRNAKHTAGRLPISKSCTSYPKGILKPSGVRFESDKHQEDPMRDPVLGLAPALRAKSAQLPHERSEPLLPRLGPVQEPVSGLAILQQALPNPASSTLTVSAWESAKRTNRRLPSPSVKVLPGRDNQFNAEYIPAVSSGSRAERERLLQYCKVKWTGGVDGSKSRDPRSRTDTLQERGLGQTHATRGGECPKQVDACSKTSNHTVAQGRRNLVAISSSKPTVPTNQSPSLSKSSRIPTPSESRGPSSIMQSHDCFSPGLERFAAHPRQYRPSNRMSLNHPANPGRTPSAETSEQQTWDKSYTRHYSTCATDDFDSASDFFSRAVSPSRITELAASSSTRKANSCSSSSEALSFGPCSRHDPIDDYMPLLWWLGRFSAMQERLRTEELSVKTAIATNKGVTDLGAGLDLEDRLHPANNGMFDSVTRYSVVYSQLRELCVTKSAIESFLDFKRKNDARKGRDDSASAIVPRKSVPESYKEPGNILRKLGIPEYMRKDRLNFAGALQKLSKPSAVGSGLTAEPRRFRPIIHGRSVDKTSARAGVRRERRTTDGTIRFSYGSMAKGDGSCSVPPSPLDSRSRIPSSSNVEMRVSDPEWSGQNSRMDVPEDSLGDGHAREQPRTGDVIRRASMFERTANKRWSGA